MYAGLGCLFTFVFIIIFFIVAAVGNLLRVFFGFNNLHKKTARQQPRQTYTQRSNSSNASSASEGKIFDKNEGEYVDFEEVKD